MIRRPPRSTLFPTRRSSDLDDRMSFRPLVHAAAAALLAAACAQPIAQPVSPRPEDRKSTRLNSSHMSISYAVFCLKKKTKQHTIHIIYKNKISRIRHLFTDH